MRRGASAGPRRRRAAPSRPGSSRSGARPPAPAGPEATPRRRRGARGWPGPWPVRPPSAPGPPARAPCRSRRRRRAGLARRRARGGAAARRRSEARRPATVRGPPRASPRWAGSATSATSSAAEARRSTSAPQPLGHRPVRAGEPVEDAPGLRVQTGVEQHRRLEDARLGEEGVPELGRPGGVDGAQGAPAISDAEARVSALEERLGPHPAVARHPVVGGGRGRVLAEAVENPRDAELGERRVSAPS